MAPAPQLDDRPSAVAASGEAFDLPGGPEVALLLHGLTGSPYEMRHVAMRLHRHGLRCVGPVMPGHGGDPRALVSLPWTAWVGGARRELDRLAPAQVLLVGCSMGALVACALAHEAPERVKGLALLAPALHLSGSARLAAVLARTPLARLVPVLPKLGGSDVSDPEQRRANPTMSAVPLRAVAELQRLARFVDGVLPGIRTPALVIAGRRDHTVALSGARRLARRIGSGPAQLVILERSSHLVGIDVERDRCAAEVTVFLDRLAGTSGGERQGPC